MSETKLKRTNTANEKKEEKEITKEFMKSLFGGLDFDLCLALIKASLVDIAKQYMWESEIPDKEKARRALIAFEAPFPHEEELKQKSARLAELNAMLNLDKKDNEVADDDRDDEREHKDFECCCDECDWFLLCYPEYDL